MRDAAEAVMTALLVASLVVSASPKMSERDLRVLAMLHEHNAIEMELGKLAQTQAGSKDVKAFGALVAKDHAFLDKQVLAVAGATLPKYVPENDDERARREQLELTVAHLKTLHGEAFDQAFTDALMRWHQDDISAVEAQRSMTQDAHVYGLLGKILPVLREHRSIAEKLTRGERSESSG
jgi:putative membrane protein